MFFFAKLHSCSLTVDVFFILLQVFENYLEIFIINIYRQFKLAYPFPISIRINRNTNCCYVFYRVAKCWKKIMRNEF